MTPDDVRPPLPMAGKTALVTGGAGGIGAAIAAQLHAAGAFVYLADRDERAGTASTGQLGQGAKFLPLDVTDDTAWDAAMRRIETDGRNLTTFVSSAGIAHRSAVLDTNPEDFRRVLDTNLTGAFLGIQHAGRRLEDGGSITTVSSVNGIVATAGIGAYCASKSAVCMLSRVAALEFADRRIRVNTVCPGPVDTPLIHGRGRDEQDWAAYLQTIPFRRTGTTHEVAAAVLYLASDAAAYVTGTELVLDGGISAGRDVDVQRYNAPG